MKKFLVFLVAIVVVVSLGLTTYYFMRNDEVIVVETKEIFCNAGDLISIDELKISRKKAHRLTTFDYNAGGEEVSKLINYDETAGGYIVSEQAAGDVTLVIKTTNNNYGEFNVNVHIGNGTEQNPFFILDEDDLLKIGSNYGLDKHYSLKNNIMLTDEFAPIGLNVASQTWFGFDGIFNGNGYTISNLNLNGSNYNNAGLFYSINDGAKVSDLLIDGANINGSYLNAGVLAGEILGDVEKIGVKNANIINTADASHTGALAGKYMGETLNMCYAENSTITVGAELAQGATAPVVSGAVVGGLVAKLDETTVQACYTNNVTIDLLNADGFIGGFAGEFVIGTQTGSIQQSYANTISDETNYAAFVYRVTKNSTFDNKTAKMLKHFIGNFAIVSNKTSAQDIVDSDLVKEFDNTYFANVKFTNNSVFYDRDASLYLVRGFATIGEVLNSNEYVYYAVDLYDVAYWDDEFVWNITDKALPTLRLGNVSVSSPSNKYFDKDMQESGITNNNNQNTGFVNVFSQDVANQSIKLLEDIDLSSGWNPVSLTNCVFDGNGKTIKVNLNNGSLFTSIDNCSIENLTIEVVEVPSQVETFGALTSKISSSDPLSTSLLKGVKVVYSCDIDSSTITNFGGLVGTMSETEIINSEIAGLNITNSANITNVGAIACESSGKISNVVVNASICGNKTVGGVVATNNGLITSVSGEVVINVNSNVESVVGGLAGLNNSEISNNDFNVEMTISSSEKTFVGGIAGLNNGTIENTAVRGNGISVSGVQNAEIGGVSAVNNGTISETYNYLSNVGTYEVGNNQYVGGIVATNNGKIEKVVVTSNVYGNVVAGVVATMNNVGSTIDQVYIAGNLVGDARNTIKGDKYVAGIAVDFRLGTISNVQAISAIEGGANSTRSSLIVLIFPYGAKLSNSTINSSISGYGTMYRETWADFASYSNRAEFGFGAATVEDGSFNLYTNDTFHGSMQSVVISNNEGVENSISSLGGAFAMFSDYTDSSESSFVKFVGEFVDVSQFQGEYTFVHSKSAWFGIEHTATRELTFSIGSTWKAQDGIRLMFVDNAK